MKKNKTRSWETSKEKAEKFVDWIISNHEWFDADRKYSGRKCILTIIQTDENRSDEWEDIERAAAEML